MDVIYEPKGRALEYAPLAANLYKGCSHGCLYCYAPPATRTSRADFLQAHPRQDILARLERDATKLHGDPREILLSFTTDPYQPLDATLHLTRQALEILARHQLAVTVLTKGPSRAWQDFDFLARNPRNRFGVSLTFANDEDSRLWEPMADLPGDRIRMLEWAKKERLTTWVSLEPVIEPEQTLDLIRRSWPWVDTYAVGKLNHHPRAHCTDWQLFRRDLVELLQRLGKPYFLKADLLAASRGASGPAPPPPSRDPAPEEAS